MNPKAIEILNKDQGFFLMVEAGRIDQAHHETWANRALEETLDLDEAIEIALKMVNLDETLIIVTADHSHTFTISGYSDRGSDIRGLTNRVLDDDLPYSILRNIYTFFNSKFLQIHLIKKCLAILHFTS